MHIRIRFSPSLSGGNNRSKFGKPEDDYKDKRICVSGKIKAKPGLPEIVVDDPKQIRNDAEE